MKWCRKTGVEPMMAVNLGLRGAAEARDLVEYCNARPGSFWADKRAANDSPEPHNIKLWCLGNEMDGPWQVGHKDAHDYALTANSASRAMKYVDPDIETVLCGSSSPGMSTFIDWEREVLEECWDTVDYLSMHQYFGCGNGDVESFLARSISMDGFIESVGAVIDSVKAKKRSKKNIYLSFDEWNVWYHSHGAPHERWSERPHLLEDEYDFADVLVVGTMLNSLLRHSDRVKVACLAQIVNVIAPILTEDGGRLCRQTTYFPFALTAKFARGTTLEQRLSCPVHDTKEFGETPDLDTVATIDGDRLTVIAVNRSMERDITLEGVFKGFGKLACVEAKTIAGHELGAKNTFDSETVVPADAPAPLIDGHCVTARLPALSWNIFVFDKTD